MKPNPYRQPKVRKIELSEYLKQNIGESVRLVMNMQNVTNIRWSHVPCSEGAYLATAMQDMAKMQLDWLLNGFDRGELIGLS